MEYGELVWVYQKLENTTKRLEKTSIIANLLRNTRTEDLARVALLLQGRLYPQWDQREIGVASRLVLKAINVATGIDIDTIEVKWKDTGDLGKTAEELVGKKKQATLFSTKLTVSKVFENLEKLSSLEGEGTVDRKISLIAELLTSATPSEAKYIVRTVLEDLRVGVGEGSIRDAIVWAFFGDKIKISYTPEDNELVLPDDDRKEYETYVNAVQEAYDIANDFSKVAIIAKEKGIEGLKNIEIEIGKPLKAMLYQKAANMQEAFETVGKPCAIEYKYDGFRLQLHRKGEKIWLYTRRLENVTKQFPDVVEVIRNNILSKDYILDAEIIGFDKATGKWLPFQSISQRIKRKYNIYQMLKDIPVIINVFDAMLINGKNIIKEPFETRRRLISEIVKLSENKLNIAKEIITSDENIAEKFYEESLSKGNEGIMVKNLSAPYKPGSRVGYGVKVKPVMERLDLAIVGADWGEGKRANWLSSFVIACIDENGNFLEIGRVGTGIKEKEGEGATFEQLTNMLKPLIISEKGKEIKVKPSVVIEVDYEEIQKSVNYNSGFALRFPRLISIREDRTPEEISTLETVEELYDKQRQRNETDKSL
jgi:DNA ligase-1